MSGWFFWQVRNVRVDAMNVVCLNRFLSSKQKRLSSLSTKSRAATMSDDDITILAQSIRLVSFSPGHVLFEQGMKGDVMYGVLSGEINVFVHDFNVLMIHHC